MNDDGVCEVRENHATRHLQGTPCSRVCAVQTCGAGKYSKGDTKSCTPCSPGQYVRQAAVAAPLDAHHRVF